MRSFKQFFESKELRNLDFHPISGLEEKIARRVQKLAIAIHDFLAIKETDIKPEDVTSLRDVFVAYGRGFAFAKVAVKYLNSYLESHDKAGNAVAKLKDKHEELGGHSKNLKAAFLSGDRGAMRSSRDGIKAILDQIDHNIDLKKEARQLVKSSFMAEPSFFGSSRLLSTIGSKEYEAIRAIDFSKQQYSSLDFPHAKSDDFDFVLFYMISLSDSPKPKRLMNAHSLRIHAKVEMANDPRYQELLKLLDVYLHNNDTSLIPKIHGLIESIPAVKSANDAAKKKIKVVYRGLGFGERMPSYEAIIAKEKENKYVATSDSHFAAKNFALQKGHLESADERRSEYGIIIEYAVKPDAILFDTKVIETVYNESEILIDARKAEVKNIEEI